jgi:hypothetical protein
MKGWSVLFAIACATAGCSGSGGTGSAVAASAPVPAPSPTPAASSSPSPTPTLSPTPSPGPTLAPTSSCAFEGTVSDIGPRPGGTYQVLVTVGPANHQGVALTNLKIRFGFVNSSFVSASPPAPPTTTFDTTTLTWTIGSLPTSGAVPDSITLTMTNLPPLSFGGTTFLQVHEQTTADQCAFSDVDAFETNL